MLRRQHRRAQVRLVLARLLDRSQGRSPLHAALAAGRATVIAAVVLLGWLWLVPAVQAAVAWCAGGAR